MVIDMASVIAERYKGNPQILQAAVLGQGPAPGVDPFTALRALQLLKQSSQDQMAQQAQQPTKAPSLVQQAIGQPVPQLGMGMPQQPQQSQPQQPPQAGLGALAAAPQQAQPGPSQGLAGLPSGQQNFAPGGIVAFGVGGTANAESGDPYHSNIVDMPTSDLTAIAQQGSEGDPNTYNLVMRELARRLSQPQTPANVPPAYTPEQVAEQQEDIIKRYAGPDYLSEYINKYQYSPEQKEEDMRQARGQGLLRVAAAMTRPGRGLFQALGEAGAAFGDTYAAAQQAQQAKEQALDKMRVQLLDAQRKEKIGLIKQAHDTVMEARKSAVDAARADQQAQNAQLQTLAHIATATRPQRPASQSLGIALMEAEKAYRLNPTPENAAAVKAARDAASQMATKFTTSDVGPTRGGLTAAGIRAGVDKAVSAQVEKNLRMNPDYMELSNSKKPDELARARKIRADEEAKVRATFSPITSTLPQEEGGPPIIKIPD